MLSGEETIEIKKKLISHIENSFDSEQAISAKAQIESMDSEQLESFLKKNKIMIQDKEDNNCIFCSIVEGKINSCKLLENKKAIAVLDINSISKGHTLVIQKEHSEEIQKGTKELAEEIAEIIKEKFKPKRVEFSESKVFGHGTINVLPIYHDENFDSKKTHLEIENLEEIKKELEQEEEEKEEEIIPVKEVEKFLWLPKRMP
jgi:histidine triad (HIT) family protein